MTSASSNRPIIRSSAVTVPAALAAAKWRLVKTSLVTGILAWCAIFCCESATCSADDPSDNSSDIVAITYNIRYLNRNDGPDHWDKRVDSVAGVIRGGDVVGLQEATRPQIDDLVKRLPEWDWYGVGRDDARDKGEFSPIFWRKDRFRSIKSGTFWLGPDPMAVGVPAWEAKIPRICSWVLLSPVADDSNSPIPTFAVFNTHFDHQSGLARLNSAKLIREKIVQIAPNMPLIFMGDLNCRPDSQPIGALVATANEDRGTQLVLVDTLATSATKPQGPTGTWNAFKAIDPQTRIDYVFVRPDVPKVISHLTADPRTDQGRFASDHLPVIVGFRF